jgi:hypothetical protein
MVEVANLIILQVFTRHTLVFQILLQKRLGMPFLERVNKLQPKIINDASTDRVSYVFDESVSRKIFPEIVYSSKHPKTGKLVYGINYNEIGVIAIKAIQEQQELINDVKQKNEILQAKNAELEQRLSKLEALIKAQKNISANTQDDIIAVNGALEQNIPNPFNKSTTIRYSIPANSTSAFLVINDQSGKQLKHVLLQKGIGTINFDASTLPTGAFSYALLVDGKILATRKMIVAR